MSSIRRALLLSIIGTTTLVLLIAAAFSYRSGLREADELFDAKLAHSSRVLMSLMDAPLAELPERRPGAATDAPLVVKVWHGNAGGEDDDPAQSTGHVYETKLAFQVRDTGGIVLLRSESGPARPLAPLAPGFGNVVIDGEHWRTFTLQSPGGRWYQSGELAGIRAEIAEEIAFGTMLPLLLALPLLAILAWLAVDWACGSLRRVSDAVDQRVPERMAPIALSRVPREIAAIIGAVNGLLERLQQALSREKRFTADAAHELRTPIAALKLHAYNLAHAADADERAQSQQRLDAGIARMERLVAQLLALSRIESDAPPATAPAVPVDLADVARRCRDDVLAATGIDDARIRLDLAPVAVTGDELLVDAVVRNLVDNAVRYAARGEVSVRIGREGDRAMLVVEDAGPGIPEDARARVFSRFQRELGSGVEGSGLGLSIVAEALQRLGGTIVLDASPALGGLRATVTLPVA
ncbi:MAG: sensor histidine kinase N-terminal domain-containing protein [Xanthomonadaceae bacterium]|nr:sensor histidine kinase N-terminal domain-containing protein [Xanthomonadaceae bacterium]